MTMNPPGPQNFQNLSAAQNIPPGVQLSVLVFLRSLATPVVLYTENAQQLYDELRQVIRQVDPKSPKLIEKQGLGPLKKFSFLDTDLSGVALQNDPALSQR